LTSGDQRICHVPFHSVLCPNSFRLGPFFPNQFTVDDARLQNLSLQAEKDYIRV
jgi:hypothetical protein